MLEILTHYRSAFLGGLVVTAQLTAIVCAIGLTVGTLAGALSARYPRLVGIPARIASFALSGIPVLVLLFWAHYPLQALLGVVVSPFLTAAAILTIVNSFAVADTIRTHLSNFPREYITAARVCGLTPRETMCRVQLPLLLRQLVPALLPIRVVMLQSTLFASLISVDEVFRVAQRINAIEYRPVEIYTALAVLFLLICLPLNGLALWLRWRFTRDVSEH